MCVREAGRKINRDEEEKEERRWWMKGGRSGEGEGKEEEENDDDKECGETEWVAWKRSVEEGVREGKSMEGGRRGGVREQCYFHPKHTHTLAERKVFKNFPLTHLKIRQGKQVGEWGGRREIAERKQARRKR